MHMDTFQFFEAASKFATVESRRTRKNISGSSTSALVCWILAHHKGKGIRACILPSHILPVGSSLSLMINNSLQLGAQFSAVDVPGTPGMSPAKVESGHTSRWRDCFAAAVIHGAPKAKQCPLLVACVVAVLKIYATYVLHI